MEKEQTCCVTGHRDIPKNKIDIIQEKLAQEILTAINAGYRHFISGFASGADLIFAEIVAAMKNEYPITLEAAIPYPGRLKTPDKTFQRLIRECDTTSIHSNQYSNSCYMIRNRYMVDHSSLVLAVYDGRGTGGTAATIRYANKAGRTVKEIRL